METSFFQRSSVKMRLLKTDGIALPMLLIGVHAVKRTHVRRCSSRRKLHTPSQHHHRLFAATRSANTPHLIRRLTLRAGHDHLQAVREIAVGSALHHATAALRNGEFPFARDVSATRDEDALRLSRPLRKKRTVSKLRSYTLPNTINLAKVD
jgi:hypothetical protein